MLNKPYDVPLVSQIFAIVASENGFALVYTKPFLFINTNVDTCEDFFELLFEIKTVSLTFWGLVGNQESLSSLLQEMAWTNRRQAIS